MGEKDVSQKILEGKNDVFADIVNGCCFNGKEIIKPDELQDLSGITAYEDKQKYRSTQRDITKLWKKGIINIACLGVENQTYKDNTMPLRVLSLTMEPNTKYSLMMNRLTIILLSLLFCIMARTNGKSQEGYLICLMYHLSLNPTLMIII